MATEYQRKRQRPHAIAVQAASVARLVAAKARADGFGPDDWRVLEGLQHWATRLTHAMRLRHLAELGERTDDLWLLR